MHYQLTHLGPRSVYIWDIPLSLVCIWGGGGGGGRGLWPVWGCGLLQQELCLYFLKNDYIIEFALLV